MNVHGICWTLEHYLFLFVLLFGLLFTHIEFFLSHMMKSLKRSKSLKFKDCVQIDFGLQPYHGYMVHTKILNNGVSAILFDTGFILFYFSLKNSYLNSDF